MEKVRSLDSQSGGSELVMRAAEQENKLQLHKLCFVTGTIGTTRWARSLSPNMKTCYVRNMTKDELIIAQGSVCGSGGRFVLRKGDSWHRLEPHQKIGCTNSISLHVFFVDIA